MDRESKEERSWIISVIAILFLLCFAAYLGFFLREWGLALLVVVLTATLGATIFVLSSL